MTKQKIVGLLFIIIGVPFGITALDGIFPVSVFISQGLLLIFFSPERINDERVQQLKMKALYTTLSTAFGLLFVAYAMVHVLLKGLLGDFGPGPRELHHFITAWDFLAGVLLVALGLFHFHRWQDARGAREYP